MKNKILFVIAVAWIALWAFFIAREIFLKGSINSYKALLSRSLEGKRSYLMGDRLYEFISFSMKELPENARYKLVGLEEGSVNQRRASYYLYPRIEAEDAPFILVYDNPDGKFIGYETFGALDGSRYILKKKGIK